jgi:hypothetical protein
MTNAYQTSPPVEQLSWLELNRIASLQEASRLSGLSPDSLRRHHGHRIVKLSPRRSGMRVIDALMIQQAAWVQYD